ncbi:MAG: hypothetical protein Q7N50_00605 [Armatimonadota bacterium]|nr:hypothetical protein [Armatimonadota bacterium]
MQQSIAGLPIHTRLVSGFPFRCAPFKSRNTGHEFLGRTVGFGFKEQAEA